MSPTSSRSDKLKVAVATLGAAALLVAGVATVSEAAGAARSVLLGKSNKETKTTKITNKKAKPALALKSKGNGPALSVNTTGLVKNLNADLLDGKSLDQVSPTAQSASLGTAGAAGSGTDEWIQTTSLPSGTYEFFLGGAISAGTGDNNACAVIDGTRYINSGGTDIAAIFIYDSTDPEGGISELSGHFIGPVVAGNRLLLGCNFDTTSTVVQPVQLTVRKLDSTSGIPGIGATTFPKGATSPLR